MDASQREKNYTQERADGRDRGRKRARQFRDTRGGADDKQTGMRVRYLQR